MEEWKCQSFESLKAPKAVSALNARQKDSTGLYWGKAFSVSLCEHESYGSRKMRRM
jgi:hypothetical protein